MTETVAALHAAGIRPSKLCAHCFGARIRRALANTYRTASA